MIGIDARASREVSAVLVALSALERDLLKEINAQSKTVIIPIWKQGLDGNSKTPAEKQILAATGKALVSGTGVKLRAGIGAKPLSGGLSSEDNRAIEFGANREQITNYRSKSRKGRQFTVSRHAQRQLVWKRKAGPVYKTAEQDIPRIASLWIQTTVRLLWEAVEKR